MDEPDRLRMKVALSVLAEGHAACSTADALVELHQRVQDMSREEAEAVRGYREAAEACARARDALAQALTQEVHARIPPAHAAGRH